MLLYVVSVWCFDVCVAESGGVEVKMTDTSEADVTPRTNGFGDGEEDDRTKMRPADIDAVSYHLLSIL